ncbi:hypothetical protein HvAV-3i_gp112 [Heliothis virescens ascovirus 3i]|nr:hypothetical protein HvAV-3i_gp112 [Heliothis virescens ascovirus 3i]
MYFDIFQCVCYLTYALTAISICILMQFDRMTLVYYAGLMYLDIEQICLYYYEYLKSIVAAFATADLPTALYHSETATYRLSYRLNGQLHTLVIPKEDVIHDRRYAYTDSDGVYVKLDSFVGPTGNFHGMNVTMKHLGLKVNGDLRLLDLQQVGKPPICLGSDDVLRYM